MYECKYKKIDFVLAFETNACVFLKQ